MVAFEDSDIAARVDRALHGRDELISHPDTSQYASGGPAACGLASLNFARLFFEKEVGKSSEDQSLLAAIVGKDNVMVGPACCLQSFTMKLMSFSEHCIDMFAMA